MLEYAKLGSPSSPVRSWADFYEGRDTPAYRGYVKRHYYPFLKLIVDEVRRPSHLSNTVLEVGCGFGTITHILTRHQYRDYDASYVATDVCPDMLDRAGVNLRGRARVFRADMRSSGWMKADIIHGHGVLEHFDDDGIAATLESHKASGARVAIHYVPGDLHGKPSFGDERLMAPEWWRRRFAPTHTILFNGGKDYALVWEFKENG